MWHALKSKQDFKIQVSLLLLTTYETVLSIILYVEKEVPPIVPTGGVQGFHTGSMEWSGAHSSHNCHLKEK